MIEKITEIARSILGRQELIEMTRIKKERYGLPMDIWISPRMASHGPRIKVATAANSRFGRDDSITISIGEHPAVLEGDASPLNKRDLDAVKSWIAANRDVLMKHWTQGYDDLDLAADLKPAR